MNISNFKVNPNNPRKIKDANFEKLVESIKSFPKMLEKCPLVCVTDSDGKLYPLGGNMRLLAIKKAGYKEIPENWFTLADDWTEDERKEFLIKDNISFGEWDFDILANEWDTEKLEEWGLDIPNFTEEREHDENVRELTNMIAVSLTNEELEIWLKTKEKIGKNKDKTVIFELIKHYLNEAIN